MKASVTLHISKTRTNTDYKDNENLIVAFNSIKNLLKKHIPPLSQHTNNKTHYELWTNREIVLKGKKRRKGIMFGSLMMFKDYIGFYFQPLYFSEDLSRQLPPDLLSLKTGVTSFHLSSASSPLLLSMEIMIIEGLEFYRSKNWL